MSGLNPYSNLSQRPVQPSNYKLSVVGIHRQQGKRPGDRGGVGTDSLATKRGQDPGQTKASATEENMARSEGQLKGYFHVYLTNISLNHQEVQLS